MWRHQVLSATAILVSLLAAPCGAGEVGDYLTEEGQLTETLTIRIGGRGFLAPPDEVWIIQPTGEWAWEATDSKGKLTAQQLAILAQHLAAQDFKSLPDAQGYLAKVLGGFDHVVISFGKKQAAFKTQNGKTRGDYLPKPGDANADAWSRFMAVELVLADLLQMAEVRAEYGIESSPVHAQ